MENKISEKEIRIRSITNIYYSKPPIQEAILNFSKDREVVPRYFEGFGKRPDMLQYPSDIMGMVRKGATSFHCSEELWEDVFRIDSDMSRKELDNLRKGWDLLIDVDSPFLDCSKIATKLIIDALEQHGIKNYGLKFSGSKGFHILVSWNAFPKSFRDKDSREMFPEWPRAISEYLMNYIRRDYNTKAGEILDLESIEKRTNLKREELTEVYCTLNNRPAVKGNIVKLKCPVCGLEVERRNYKITKRRLKCLNNDCAGVFEIVDEKEYYYSEYDKDPENDKLPLSSDKYPEYFEEQKGISAEKIASLDLVLVAPRHLFRAPYSLHEKTGLSSVVIDKDDLEKFNPKMADPLKVCVRDFYPENADEEARGLLARALDWKMSREKQEDDVKESKYSGKNIEINPDDVTEDMFPKPIKKLLKGISEGRKRGLFILITFFKSLGFSPDYINKNIRDWNERNEVPLKEGYVRSQIEWHLKQKKKILPPNYENESFYKDLGLIDFSKKPDVKNPLVDVMRKIKNKRY